jgi:hypothetical protein
MSYNQPKAGEPWGHNGSVAKTSDDRRGGSPHARETRIMGTLRIYRSTALEGASDWRIIRHPGWFVIRLGRLRVEYHARR